MGWLENLWKRKSTEKTVADPVPLPTPAKVIKVSDYLNERTICFFPPGVSKQDALKQLVDCFGTPDAPTVLKAIMDREAAGTTVIAPGIAVPHARVQGVSKLMASVGLSSSGVQDPSTEGGLIKLFVLFVGPANNMKEHLGFLASVASLFQVDGFGDTLIQLTTPQAVLEKIREVEKGL